MLCIPKKNDTIRTVFDLRQQNKNTWKDLTPFPDQDAIHHDIAQATFRSKSDMTEAYEQKHIRPERSEEHTSELSHSDLLGPLPLKLPPFHEVSHEIPLIDESKQLKHRLPKCPEAFCSELALKIEQYTTAEIGRAHV